MITFIGIMQRKQIREHFREENEEPKTKKRQKQTGGLPPGISIERVEGEDLAINKIETSKDLIKQPRLAEDERKIIPHIGASIVINGKSGSGKSTLLTNLITGPQFFGKSPEQPEGWFDEIFLFSPTADGDDVQKALGIKKEHVYTDLDEAPELINVILSTQKEKLAGGGKAHKVKQFCIIFDDVIGETQFMNTKEFLQTFYMVRHRNCTTFICSQHYKRIPKVCRQQASFVFFFAGSQAEVETVVEDFSPPLYSRKEFADLVNYATADKHSFLTVCMKVDPRLRFRKNLDEILALERFSKEDNQNEEKKEPTPKKKSGGLAGKAQICEDKSNEFHRNLQAVIKHLKQKHEQHEQASTVLGQR
jgi:energy-coupling factor transporter ATP-binding protein EcfA2